jgi:hypothetical protein
MNTPGFTAEATLYKTVTSYRSNGVIHTEVGLNVKPQMGFIGEWLGRVIADAVWYGEPSGSDGSSPAEIFARRTCIALTRRCDSGDMKACQRLLKADCD